MNNYEVLGIGRFFISLNLICSVKKFAEALIRKSKFRKVKFARRQSVLKLRLGRVRLDWYCKHRYTDKKKVTFETFWACT